MYTSENWKQTWQLVRVSTTKLQSTFGITILHQHGGGILS
jgi:hypothetical protein